jgi:uncharacterized protein YegP (UPF0339 family)
MGLFSIFKKKKKTEAVKPEAPKALAPKTEIAKNEAPKKPEAPKAPEKPKATEAPKKPEAPKTPEKPKATEAPKKPEAPKMPEKPKAPSAPKSTPAKKPLPKAESATTEEAKTEPKKSSPVGKFEIKKAKDERYVFNLYAANQVIVATSQVYSSSTAAMNGIKSVIENAPKAPVEDQTLKSYDSLPYPKWEIYQDKGGQYRFRLNASNGSCICHSQGYTSKSSCKNGIESIIRTSKNAIIDKAYLKKD